MDDGNFHSGCIGRIGDSPRWESVGTPTVRRGLVAASASPSRYSRLAESRSAVPAKPFVSLAGRNAGTPAFHRSTIVISKFVGTTTQATGDATVNGL
ncbi:hypothetical protein EHQ05_01870 [Leptospira yasudae]|uniref:hypothetical protein n=1 Tax=Leptospira yasudae TaxID=2202201 RepID=UPI0010826051|nr:hypothetical protein [Leptospira yasudae]TGK29738.1 hypothetical protein EHQ05_01870 [Leptospira yasudae]TGM07637.1 hypothetical protein EHQ86_06145 [Leptospira yasudae]